jgi:hypothetical protein
MTTTATVISRDAIYEAVKEAYRTSLERGGGRWYYVRAWPDGEITTGIEASPCYPESEYYRREPHPVTVWETRSNSDLDDTQIEAEMDAFDWEWFETNVGDLDAKLRPTCLSLAD